MFSFFHRTPKIHVDCFTCDRTIYSMTPIVRASKTLPEWWKKLPKRNLDDLDPSKRNMKDCQGFVEFYKKGLVIESWCDYVFETTKERFTTDYSSWLSPVNHSSHTYNHSFPNHMHIKLTSAWKLSEKTGVKFVFMGAEWALHDYDFKVLPGIMEFSLNSNTDINLMLPKKDQKINLRMGQPLVHIIPLSEKELSYKNHIVSQQEMNDRINSLQSFYGWRYIAKLAKRNSERENAKCPFHGVE